MERRDFGGHVVKPGALSRDGGLGHLKFFRSSSLAVGFEASWDSCRGVHSGGADVVEGVGMV